MKLTWWFNLKSYTRWLIGSLVIVAFWVIFFWGIILIGLPPKRVAAWSCVVVWFIHLLIGAGAGYASWRLWPNRLNRFIKLTAIHLQAITIDALAAIVLLFMAQNVVFTWKFSLAFFGFTLARDLARLPLILYIIRGPSEPHHVIAPQWSVEFEEIRKEIADLREIVEKQ